MIGKITGVPKDLLDYDIFKYHNPISIKIHYTGEGKFYFTANDLPGCFYCGDNYRDAVENSRRLIKSGSDYVIDILTNHLCRHNRWKYW